MALTYTHISENKRKTAILITAFLVLIIGLGYAFSYIYQSTGLLVGAVIFSTTMALISYFYSDKIALSLSKAKEVNRQNAPDLYRMVENLCITAGLPVPKIYIIEDTAMNAFATGRDPEHAAIAFTTGILQRLDKAELEGVIAHELSHIGNYDIRLSTIVVVLVGIIALLSDWFLRVSFFGRRDSNGQSNAILLVAGLVLAILSPIIATIIQLAISRKREYLADASGVLLTRYPAGLSGALRKLSGDHEPLEVANKATAHMYITNPLKEHERKKDSIGWFAKLFSTHPPIEDRIKRLEEMNL